MTSGTENGCTGTEGGNKSQRSGTHLQLHLLVQGNMILRHVRLLGRIHITVVLYPDETTTVIFQMHTICDCRTRHAIRTCEKKCKIVTISQNKTLQKFHCIWHITGHTLRNVDTCSKKVLVERRLMAIEQL